MDGILKKSLLQNKLFHKINLRDIITSLDLQWSTLSKCRKKFESNTSKLKTCYGESNAI